MHHFSTYCSAKTKTRLKNRIDKLPKSTHQRLERILRVEPLLRSRLQPVPKQLQLGSILERDQRVHNAFLGANAPCQPQPPRGIVHLGKEVVQHRFGRAQRRQPQNRPIDRDVDGEGFSLLQIEPRLALENVLKVEPGVGAGTLVQRDPLELGRANGVRFRQLEGARGGLKRGGGGVAPLVAAARVVERFQDRSVQDGAGVGGVLLRYLELCGWFDFLLEG